MAACTSARIAGVFGDGALYAMLVVEKQIHRRGCVDWSALLAAIEYADRVRRSRR